ncbi:Rrf2 family transcriptional regulator [Falsiroseomonas tokyonensis]|uniref:Rrf2 family transcriptional regulator n=1 Tax=Falsiroseomonas tokyonensis TaxID=430521 RepID=A0ABV7BX67_9PROT|nr:Rrf2 family transcriptional regulator [Falsiroseomonas tokyonensis]MBU8538646.1 Rrf2 family transcriptional regulator [Falsiroseomonas tokyonensis]
MRLSTRGRYAVMAMVELAAREGDSPEAGAPGRQQVSLAEIAQAQRLSLAYLEQLFGPLRRAGLVASTRGPGGGYRLARAAREISIAAIVDAVDEPIQATRCEEGGPGCLAGERCLTHDLWAELGNQIHLFLVGVSLEDVVCGRIAGRAVAPLCGGAVAPLRGGAPGLTLPGPELGEA